MIYKISSLITNYKQNKRKRQLIVRYRKESRVKQAILDKQNYPKKLIAHYSCFVFKALGILILLAIATLAMSCYSARLSESLINQNIGLKSNPSSLDLPTKKIKLGQLQQLKLSNLEQEPKMVEKLEQLKDGIYTKYFSKPKIIERLAIPSVYQKIPITSNIDLTNLANMIVKVAYGKHQVYITKNWQTANGISKINYLKKQETKYYTPKIYLAKGTKVYKYQLLKEYRRNISDIKKVIQKQKNNYLIVVQLENSKRANIFIAKIVNKTSYENVSYAIQNTF